MTVKTGDEAGVDPRLDGDRRGPDRALRVRRAPDTSPGEYEVDYEVISWDGDPVDGDYGFTLDPTAPPPVQLLRDDALIGAGGDGAGADGSDGASGGRTFATILILVALLVAVVAVAVTVLRWSGSRAGNQPGRRAEESSETGSEPSPSTPSDD